MADIHEPPSSPAGAGGETIDLTTSAKEHAATVAHTAADEAKGVASEAASEAKDVLADAREQLRTQANEQADKVATLLGDISSQLRTMADAGEPGVATDVVAGAADQTARVSQRLSDGGLDRTLEDARRLARNRPGLFLAGAAFAGFVAARVARAADLDRLKDAASPSNGTQGNGQQGASMPGPVPWQGSEPPVTAASSQERFR